jgi:hypothetical protein
VERDSREAAQHRQRPRSLDIVACQALVIRLDARLTDEVAATGELQGGVCLALIAGLQGTLYAQSLTDAPTGLTLSAHPLQLLQQWPYDSLALATGTTCGLSRHWGTATHLLCSKQLLLEMVSGILCHTHDESVSMIPLIDLSYQLLQLALDVLRTLFVQHAQLECHCLQHEHTFSITYEVGLDVSENHSMRTFEVSDTLRSMSLCLSFVVTL